MQLTVNRQQLIDKLSANLSEIEQAAQAELHRIDGFRAQQRVYIEALAGYFEAIASGLRAGTFIERHDVAGTVAGAIQSDGTRYEMPRRPENKKPDMDERIKAATRTVNSILDTAVKARRAALVLLQLGTEDTIQIEAGHYERLIAEAIDFRQASVNAGLRG